jgi:hypothetical protein
MRGSIEEVKRVRLLARRYYNRLREQSEYRYSHCSFAARDAIDRAGKEVGIGYGCEGFCLDVGHYGEHGVSYLNMGDTYDTTVLFDTRNRRFFVSSYGDYVERLERDGVAIQ